MIVLFELVLNELFDDVPGIHFTDLYSSLLLSPGSKRSSSGSGSSSRQAASSTVSSHSQSSATISRPFTPHMMSGLSASARQEVQRLMDSERSDPPAADPVPDASAPAGAEEGELPDLPLPADLDLFPISPLSPSIEKWGRNMRSEDED